VALLAKPSQYQVNVSIDLVGFNIDKEYVVGYGLDADERYRDLPYLAILETPQS
jgi:hypoxanthine phosphoribosyltransferase